MMEVQYISSRRIENASDSLTTQNAMVNGGRWVDYVVVVASLRKEFKFAVMRES
jgi:hypothetical protein